MRPPLYLFLVVSAVVLIASGWTDLDWMVNLYYWDLQAVNGWSGMWSFGFYHLQWYWAYQTSLWRLMMGWFLLGWLIAKQNN